MTPIDASMLPMLPPARSAMENLKLGLHRVSWTQATKATLCRARWGASRGRGCTRFGRLQIAEFAVFEDTFSRKVPCEKKVRGFMKSASETPQTPHGNTADISRADTPSGPLSPWSLATGGSTGRLATTSGRSCPKDTCAATTATGYRAQRSMRHTGHGWTRTDTSLVGQLSSMRGSPTSGRACARPAFVSMVRTCKDSPESRRMFQMFQVLNKEYGNLNKLGLQGASVALGTSGTSPTRRLCDITAAARLHRVSRDRRHCCTRPVVPPPAPSASAAPSFVQGAVAFIRLALAAEPCCHAGPSRFAAVETSVTPQSGFYPPYVGPSGASHHRNPAKVTSRKILSDTARHRRPCIVGDS